MIILFRHAKPDIDYCACCYKDAVNKLHEYNSTLNLTYDALDEWRDELKTIVRANKPLIVYSSALPRSIKTAEYLFDPLGINVNSHPIFSEFELDILNIPRVVLSVKVWFFISRIAWFLGIRGQSQSVFHELHRSKMAAKLLEKHHHENTTVILVGHGLMNRWIVQYFRKKGLHVTQRKQNNLYIIQ